MRIVKISIEGRGVWANRSHFFLSRGPLDFQSLTTEEARIHQEQRLSNTERTILNILSNGCPTTSIVIVNLSGMSTGTIRNVITNLRRKRLIRAYSDKDWPPKYEITQEGLDILGN